MTMRTCPSDHLGFSSSQHTTFTKNFVFNKITNLFKESTTFTIIGTLTRRFLLVFSHTTLAFFLCILKILFTFLFSFFSILLTFFFSFSISFFLLISCKSITSFRLFLLFFSSFVSRLFFFLIFRVVFFLIGEDIFHLFPHLRKHRLFFVFGFLLCFSLFRFRSFSLRLFSFGRFCTTGFITNSVKRWSRDSALCIRTLCSNMLWSFTTYDLNDGIKTFNNVFVVDREISTFDTKQSTNDSSTNFSCSFKTFNRKTKQ